MLKHVEEAGNYLWEKLEELKANHSCITAHRGMGLIQGLEFAPDVPVALIVRSALLEQKLVLISAEHNTIRFIPPLVVTEAEIDEMARRLAAVI